MSTVYSIATQKGGTGKTSTAISVSAGLARQGRRVLLIDIDSQANTSKVLISNYESLDKEKTVYITILQRKPLPVHSTQVPNLDLVPGHILLAETDMELGWAKDHREARLKNQLDKIKDQYEFIFIDCPPALSWQTINAFTASDYIVVVIEPGYFELDSTIQIGKTISEVKELFNPSLKLRGFLFNKSEPTNHTKMSLDMLREAYPNHVLKTIIPKNVDLKEANMSKKDIFAYNPRSKSAEAYQRLIEELTT